MARMDEVELDGVQYRRVRRGVRMGDVIKITHSGGNDNVIEGGLYPVVAIDSWGDPQIVDEEDDDVDGGLSDYEVYEKVAVEVVPPYFDDQEKVGRGAQRLYRRNHSKTRSSRVLRAWR